MSEPTKNNCLLVLGMHRSGTSCLTGILQKSGVELGQVYTKAPYNKKGNRENAQVMALNEAVLKENAIAWDNPGPVTSWTDTQSRERESILKMISKNNPEFFGFKDPRVVLTIPFWLQSVNPIFIATYRHPIKVARSLYARNRMPLTEGIELWYQYNLRIYKLITENNCPLVNFDLPGSAYQIDVSKKIKALGLNPARVDLAVGFYSNELRNQTHNDLSGEILPDKVSDLYAMLQAYYNSE